METPPAVGAKMSDEGRVHTTPRSQRRGRRLESAASRFAVLRHPDAAPSFLGITSQRLSKGSSFLAPAAAGRGDFAGAHQVPDVLLQEFIVIVEFVMLLLDRLDAVEYHQQRVLQGLGLPRKLIPCFPP